MWKARVRQASLPTLPEGHWWSEGRIAITLFYFPDGAMQGDVDNIVKLTLDAMVGHVFRDDRQVERILVQKFEPDFVFPFSAPTPALAVALEGLKPVLYIRVSDQPFEDLS